MRPRKDRNIEGVSLSFLDVISCGFGAVILLLVLTRVFDPVTIDPSVTDLNGYLEKLQEELIQLKGETLLLNRTLIRREDQKAEEIDQLTRVTSEQADIEAAISSVSKNDEADEAIREQLAQAKQQMTAELQALLKDYQRAEDDQTIGGIPVDSEYVIFIIDTSGSMFNYAWPLVVQKLQETLEVYPNLKGIQVMNDNGSYLVSAYAKRWITDTPKMRERILRLFNLWSSTSNSSPAEGLVRALTDFQSATKDMSIYVLGDDYSGSDFDSVIEAVRKLNTGGARINAINFINPSATTDRFSILMREIALENHGTLITM